MTKKNQNILIVVLAIAVLSASVLVTLYFSGAFRGTSQVAYQNVTMTDATLACEERMQSEFDSDLRNHFVDNHSSRYDSKKFIYRIFLQAYTQNKQYEVTEFFITCYVKPSTGRISKFEVFENKEQNGDEPIRRGGDKFIEWPQ